MIEFYNTLKSEEQAWSLDDRFQEQIPNNHCFGCGPQNRQGLKIQSYWSGENQSVCDFTPLPHHSAGPLHFLNGGIISTIIDCHCVCGDYKAI